MSESDQPKRLSEVLTAIVAATEGERVSLGEILDALDNRSYGPLLLLPAVIVVSPLGAIPGMPLVTGAIVFLFAGQMLIFVSHPWLPKMLRRFAFPREKLTYAVEHLNPWIQWTERAIHHRLDVFATWPGSYLIAPICLTLSVLFGLFGVIPFAVAIPGGAVLLFALGLTARDGVLVLLGYALTAAAGWMAWYLWPF